MTTAVKVSTYNNIGIAYVSAVADIPLSAIPVDYFTSGAVSGIASDQSYVWFLNGTSYQDTIALISSFTYSISNYVDVQFINNSSGYIVSYLWDFGDGTTSTDKNPIHTYADYNTPYTVSLSAIGNVTSASSQIVTTEGSPVSAPIADFKWREDGNLGAYGNAGQVNIFFTSYFENMSLKDYSTNTPTSWLWEAWNYTTSAFEQISTTQDFVFLSSLINTVYHQHFTDPVFSVGAIRIRVRLTATNAGGSSSKEYTFGYTFSFVI